MVYVMKSSSKFVLKTSSSLFSCLAIFLAEADTKERRYASAKASTFADCRGEFRTLKKYLSKSCSLFTLETKEISIYFLKQRKLSNFNRRL